jgi:hypothetical protein
MDDHHRTAGRIKTPRHKRQLPVRNEQLQGHAQHHPVFLSGLTHSDYFVGRPRTPEDFVVVDASDFHASPEQCQLRVFGSRSTDEVGLFVEHKQLLLNVGKWLHEALDLSIRFDQDLNDLDRRCRRRLPKAVAEVSNREPRPLEFLLTAQHDAVSGYAL